MADAFKDSLDNSLANLQKQCKDRVDVPEERRFTGLDAYQKAIESGVDMVLLCTPPGFRPMQFEAAVKAGKHVFMEKPMATDAPGVRRIMAANEEAKKKKLAVAVGHHLRHEIEVPGDRPAHSRRGHRRIEVPAGVLQRPAASGSARASPTSRKCSTKSATGTTSLGSAATISSSSTSTTSTSCNWIAKGHPVEAEGMGGRQVRIGKDVGEIFDHHAVEFTYADGVEDVQLLPPDSRLLEFLRRARPRHEGQGRSPGLRRRRAVRCRPSAACAGTTAPTATRWRWTTCLRPCLAGQPYNEADWAAESTMTAILGRMATYSGKVVKWDEAINSQLDLTPKSLAWDAETLVKPGPDGIYACAVPGVTKAW